MASTYRQNSSGGGVILRCLKNNAKAANGKRTQATQVAQTDTSICVFRDFCVVFLSVQVTHSTKLNASDAKDTKGASVLIFR